MSCCCPHSLSAGRFFSFFARRYRKRFEKKGFEPSQRQLIAGLEQVGYQDATLLEIGSGVGHLHQSLLEHGAKSAVGIDLAPKMLVEAREWAKGRGLAERVDYRQGDFMQLAEDLGAADVAILDKVVCCYPDGEGLIKSSLDKTGAVYALTYPRKRWFIVAAVAVAAFLLRRLGSDFRPYVHDPAQIDHWICEAGFELSYAAKTSIWLSRVYVKQSVG